MTRSTPLLATAIGVAGAVSSSHADQIPDRETLDAILGESAINEDFESYALPRPSDVLEIPILDATTIINGQGPGLVEPGASYVSGAGIRGESVFAWQDAGWVGLPSKSIVAFMGPKIAMMMTIEYGTPVGAMGIDLRDYADFSHTTTVSVFDDEGGLIESFDLFIGGPDGVFFGYEADAIGSVTITGNPGGWSSVIDNHTYGSGGTCPWDLDGDGFVGVADLVELVLAWGDNPEHPADFDDTGDVGTPDLIELILNWGVCA